MVLEGQIIAQDFLKNTITIELKRKLKTLIQSRTYFLIISDKKLIEDLSKIIKKKKERRIFK